MNLTRFAFSLEFAKEMDNKDPLRDFPDKFYIPEKKWPPRFLYFCGEFPGLATQICGRKHQQGFEEMGREGSGRAFFKEQCLEVDARKLPQLITGQIAWSFAGRRW